MAKINAKLLLYTVKKKKDGSSPVVIRVTGFNKRKFFFTSYTCTEDEWDNNKDSFKRSYPNANKKNRIIHKKLFEIQDLIDDLNNKGLKFTLDELKGMIDGNKSYYVIDYFDKLIQEYLDNGKIGNSTVYKDTKNSLQKWVKNDKLRFDQLTYNLLKKYETHLRRKGLKDTTISVRMRTLRATYNKACRDKICKREDNPFYDYKISELNTTTEKRAIDFDDIKRIKNYEPNENTKEGDSINYFLFSFYNMGMNFTDMANLKWTNISNGRINYIRKKTGKAFSIKIQGPVQEILDYYKDFNSNGEYVFPIFTEKHKTAKAKHTRAKSALRRMNLHIKRIGEELGIEQKVTSYVARHSWATGLKRKGVPTAVISEGLGHKTEAITQVYLDNFENTTMDEANKNLLD